MAYGPPPDWEDEFRGPGGIIYGRWIPRDTNYVKKKEPAAPEPPKAPANDWIKIKVVDDQSGEIIPKVVLDLKTPDNSTEQHETRLSGLIESLGLESGNCEVSGDLTDLTIDNTLLFVGVGDSPIGQQGGQQGTSPFNPGKIPAPAPGTRYRIAIVEEHKVKTGETLKSIASSADMTWQVLAKFNWGTDDPDEINKHLFDDVGCTKKTADRKNYIFDDSDSPGILYVPKKWLQSGLATNQLHMIRVKNISKADLGKIFVQLDMEDESYSDEDNYILVGYDENDQEAYKKTMSVKDITINKDGIKELSFTGAPKNLKYSLKVETVTEGKRPNKIELATKTSCFKESDYA